MLKNRLGDAKEHVIFANIPLCNFIPIHTHNESHGWPKWKKQLKGDERFVKLNRNIRLWHGRAVAMGSLLLDLQSYPLQITG